MSCCMLVASMTMVTMMCSASTINTNTNTNTDLLRSQLDQLHSEADVTRRKANNARFRLLRLSEAAENLCRQAAVSVRKGKEDYARDLLLQKKKIKLALEKSKGRVELLDELAAKLNEAISVKEAQLVRHVASDLEVDADDAEGPVRIVSPTQNNYKTLDDGDIITFNQSDVVTEPNIGPDIVCHGNTLSYSKKEEAIPESTNRGLEATKYGSFRGPLPFNDFLEDLDSQLDTIENNLKTILELPTVALENEEKPNDSRLQLLEILENIRGARASIRKFVQEFTGTK